MFDISNAFIRAEVGDHKIVISLPKDCLESGETDTRRMLKKALYGLPISPRLWMKTLSKDLIKLGWSESFAEPGLWKFID